MLYQVQATVNYEGRNIGVPTFYLDGDIQGIVSVEHAEKIAREVIMPIQLPHVEIHMHIITLEKR